ncbi:MAG: MarR family winged helix-turn-helix transcriptional regulator [Candidatus Izemoplasmataceae bacterium]
MDSTIVKSANTVSMFCRMQMKRRMDIPIRPSEMGVLIFIHETAKQVTPVEISRYFNIKKPSVTAMLKTLIAEDYLEKKPSEEDRRSYALTCTDKGNALVNATFEDYHETMRTLKEGMGEDKFNTLMDLLDQANRVLGGEVQS